MKEYDLIEKDMEFTITYTENGIVKVKHLVYQVIPLNEKALVFFVMDHLSLWEFEKELHLRIGRTVSIDSFEYKMDGMPFIVNGKKVEQIYLSAFFKGD